MAGLAHLNKENEMLEGGVEVGLLLQLHHRVKMLVVDVSVNPEQTLQDGFGHRHEVLGEGNSCGTEMVENDDVKKRTKSLGLRGRLKALHFLFICLIIFLDGSKKSLHTKKKTSYKWKCKNSAEWSYTAVST